MVGASNNALLAWGSASEGLFRARMALAIAYAHSKAFGRRIDARAARSKASDGSCNKNKIIYVDREITALQTRRN